MLYAIRSWYGVIKDGKVYDRAYNGVEIIDLNDFIIQATKLLKPDRKGNMINRRSDRLRVIVEAPNENFPHWQIILSDNGTFGQR